MVRPLDGASLHLTRHGIHGGHSAFFLVSCCLSQSALRGEGTSVGLSGQPLNSGQVAPRSQAHCSFPLHRLTWKRISVLSLIGKICFNV